MSSTQPSLHTGDGSMTESALYTLRALSRLYAKLSEDKKTGCWNWTGRKIWNGYGVFSYKGKNSMLVHRAAYEMLVGPIPEGMQIDHLCENKVCFNPDHLEPVTNRVNQLRNTEHWVSKNAMKTHCKRGHEFNEENTRMVPRDGGKRWARLCVPCERIRYQENYERDYARKKERRKELRAAS